MSSANAALGEGSLPRGGALSATARELWAYRELFYFFAWRDIKIRYKQTVFGILWAVIQPLFTMIVFIILFGRLANLPVDNLPRPIFYLSALVPWIFLSTTITNGSTTLVANSEMLTKVYFPRMILPVSVALSNAVDLLISSLLLGVLMILYRVQPTPQLLLWPVLLVALAALAVGITTTLATLNVKYRDIRYIVPFLLQLWMFVTPIIYPTSMIPEGYRWLLALNPLSGLIEGFRYAVAPYPMDWTLLAISLVEIAALLMASLVYFRRSERAFADFV
jgi:lipopolysaccharide transport system permease protein